MPNPAPISAKAEIHVIIKDKFGPEMVLQIWDPKIGMEGFLVVDNTNLGPGKGGIRMTSNVTIDEIFRLARTMTWKNALAGLPFGGAKSILCNWIKITAKIVCEVPIKN